MSTTTNLTVLMHRISRYLTDDGIATMRDIHDAVPGRQQYLRLALADLVEQGYVAATDGPHGVRYYGARLPYPPPFEYPCPICGVTIGHADVHLQWHADHREIDSFETCPLDDSALLPIQEESGEWFATFECGHRVRYTPERGPSILGGI